MSTSPFVSKRGRAFIVSLDDLDVLAVDEQRAAELLSLSVGTLRNWRSRHSPNGPKWARLGGRVVYPIDELKAWLSSCTFER